MTDRKGTCNDCGSKDVTWVNTLKGWRLLEGTEGVGAEHWLTCSAPAADRRRRRAGLVKEIVPMSVNRVEDFRKCKVLYRQKHMNKLKLPPSPEMFLGRAVHQFAAALVLGQPEPSLLAMEVPPEIAHQWPVLEKGIREIVARVDPDKVVGVEERSTMSWKDGEATVEFEVVPDRVEIDEDLITVIDYKSSWFWPDKEDVKNNLQLQAYGLDKIKRYPFVERVRGRLELVRYGQRGVVEAYWTREELLAFEQALQREVHAIITETDFIPSPDCEECPLEWHLRTRVRPPTFTLPEMQPVIDWETVVVAPRTAEEAQKFAQGLKVLEAVLRAARGSINAYTRQNGPLRVADGGYGHFLEAEKVYKVTEVIKALEAAGVPLQEVIKFDFTAGKKYLSGKKAVPGLKDLITEAYKSGFRWAKDFDAEIAKLDEALGLADSELRRQLEESLPFVPQLLEGGPFVPELLEGGSK
jgi:RecB family exonuclease